MAKADVEQYPPAAGASSQTSNDQHGPRRVAGPGPPAKPKQPTRQIKLMVACAAAMAIVQIALLTMSLAWPQLRHAAEHRSDALFGAPLEASARMTMAEHRGDAFGGAHHEASTQMTTTHRVIVRDWRFRTARSTCHVGVAPTGYYTPEGGELGEGGFGTVTRVKDKRNKVWAMKKIDEEDDEEEWEWGEVEVMRLKLPLNAWVQEVFSTEKNIYLVMPLFSYDDLDEFFSLRYTALKQRLRSVLAQVAFAIWELHQRGIMHRDIKLGNIMLRDREGENLTLIDYGTAIFNCSGRHGGNCSHEHGAGTIAYMAYTVHHGMPYSYEVDWWSFGVLAYLLKYRLLPFGNRGFASKQRKQRVFRKSLYVGQDPDFAELLDSIIGEGWPYMNTATARLSMESPLPEMHPVLSHDYWINGTTWPGGTKAAALRAFWRGICEQHAVDPAEQCAGLFRPKPTAVLVKGCVGGDVEVAKCCCKMSRCSRDGRGKVKEIGVDALPAEEFTTAGRHACCARQLECGGAYRVPAGELGASCYD
mmetsp:Transcript_31764/g.92800  ORF Transcript_31764/g.92800 Transcript_31764/m.92800 type:complete len:532 (-) Transcript_31764:62-1657(-)